MSDTLHREMMYLATRWDPSGREPLFIRVAVPLADIRAHLNALYGGLAAAALVAIAVAGALCYALVRRQTAPVVELTRLAEGLAGGDLSLRSRLREEGEVGTLSHALNAMADSLSAMVAQARKDNNEFRTILAAMGEGVIAVDREKRVLLVNPAASVLLDFPAEGAEGRALVQLVRDEGILKATAEAVSAPQRRTLHLDPVRGRRIDVAVQSWPSRGEPEGAVLVVQDVTEATRYQELRKEFVANVSHEFRTPLTLIKGFVETLQDGAVNDPVKSAEFLNTIAKQVDQLTNLVGDLLELSRIESRPGLPRRILVDPGEIVRRVVELMAPAAAKKNQKISTEIAPDLPLIAGDPDYLHRALSNLVDNAIKYTPEEGVIRVVSRNDGDRVAIDVSDNGIGIPKEDLPRVFERFYRVDKSRSRDMGGTGLGLSIVKHVVQAHDGTVTVESEPGKGSRFRVTLPRMSEEIR
jgi:two-component system phosphate regulon sensor histidine kinase PhoR